MKKSRLANIFYNFSINLYFLFSLLHVVLPQQYFYLTFPPSPKPWEDRFEIIELGKLLFVENMILIEDEKTSEQQNLFEKMKLSERISAPGRHQDFVLDEFIEGIDDILTRENIETNQTTVAVLQEDFLAGNQLYDWSTHRQGWCWWCWPKKIIANFTYNQCCLLYTSPSPRD